MINKEFMDTYTDYISYQFKRKSSTLTIEDIQDLTQDTFEKVELYKDYFDESKGSLKTWLQLLCVHVYDRHKRGQIQIEESVSDYTEKDLIVSTNDHYYSANKDEVDRLINFLPERQRQAVYFKLILGHTHEEVADKMNVNTCNSRTLYSRGIDNLKKLINSNDPDNEILYEPKILKPYGDKPFEGDWAWRKGESPDRRDTKWYQYSKQEVIDYCLEHNLNYNLN